MRLGALNAEVRRRLVRARNLGAYAHIAGLQRTIRQRRPILANLPVEGLATRGVHHPGSGRVQRIHPLHIRAKLGLATQVNGEVHAQPGQMRMRVGCRVNQP